MDPNLDSNLDGSGAGGEAARSAWREGARGGGTVKGHPPFLPYAHTASPAGARDFAPLAEPRLY